MELKEHTFWFRLITQILDPFPDCVVFQVKLRVPPKLYITKPVWAQMGQLGVVVRSRWILLNAEPVYTLQGTSLAIN